MSGKCKKEECSLCQHKFSGRRHRHSESWPAALLSFFKEESGLSCEWGGCVCSACDVSLRKAFTARGKGEPYQLRWLKTKRVCCVPFCKSAIRAEKHNFSWEVICQCVGVASISPPADTSLCSVHYSQVYRIQHVTFVACVCCGVVRRPTITSAAFITCPSPSVVESYLRETIDFGGTIHARG